MNSRIFLKAFICRLPAILFITAWFAVSGVLVGLLLGHQRLRLEPQGLDREFRAIV
ncbi:MAG TPA: hypothetical protein VG826_01850 [Pirellulales bacterium]|nr:hypothetical protein [Pirellulales bacterium]